MLSFSGLRNQSIAASLNGLDDEDLLQHALDGHEAAFRQLIDKYMEDVSRTATGMLGASAEVDDVVQEVFIRLHGSLATFRGDASLKTYLIRVTINRCLDILRKRKRRRWLLPWQELDDIQPVAEDATDAHMESSDRNRALRAAIDRLPENQRSVVVLRWIEELSTEETAAVLGIPYGTVLSRLKRALDRLRTDVGIHFEGESDRPES